MQQNIS